VVSIADQYNIFLDELEDDDLYWKTLLRLISGLKPETHLGYLVSIRSEEDSKIRKKFTDKEKTIWIQWQQRIPIEYKQQKMMDKLKTLESKGE
jgi:hypothetical protein